MAKSVFCIVSTYPKAELIVDKLKTAGFSNNDISVLFPDTQGTKDFAHEKNTKAPEGAATGAGAARAGVPSGGFRLKSGGFEPGRPSPKTCFCASPTLRYCSIRVLAWVP